MSANVIKAKAHHLGLNYVTYWGNNIKEHNLFDATIQKQIQCRSVTESLVTNNQE